MEYRPNLEILGEAKRELLRVEVRDSYGVPSETEPFQRWLAGEPYDYRAWYEPWTGFIQGLVSRNVAVRRLRVVTVPHSDYQRWCLDMARYNTEAGETIRYLPRHLAGEVPAEDWWLIDGTSVAFNLVDQQGRANGLSGVTADPGIVGYCKTISERLWSTATPYADYTK